MNQINIPVGISDFREIRKNDYYYVDKTGLIRELLKTTATKVTLITRPRRFGKAMVMSMLANYFDIRENSQDLFAGLEIAHETDLCTEWMNQYPVVFLSLKDIDGLKFEDAYGRLVAQIADLYKNHTYLLECTEIDSDDRQIFLDLKAGKAERAQVIQSLRTLMRMIQIYYQKRVILLLDEYDVPIAKASSNGYYDEMLDVMKGMMSTALKDNSSLQFAVVTGCLQIAKESVFTGTNNFVTDSITDSRYNEFFGFTQREVAQILTDADAFYHAFLAGIFTGAGYSVESNREHGEGRSDIVVSDIVNGRVAVFEAKKSEVLADLSKDCEVALAQIDDRMYATEFEDDYDQVFCYGISFYKKRCLVKCAVHQE